MRFPLLHHKKNRVLVLTHTHPHAKERINPWFVPHFRAPALTGSAVAAAPALPRGPHGLGHVEESNTACRQVCLKPPQGPGGRAGVAGHPLSGHGGDEERSWAGGVVFVGRAARRERAPPSRAHVPVLHGAAQPALQRELESLSTPRSASQSAAHANAGRRRPAGAGYAATALRSGAGQTPREAAGGDRRAEPPQRFALRRRRGGEGG